ncbi:hypothetical protein KSP40_PGU020659 [Platanthera guangdongensis]|uniref:Peptidase M50 domain-containing protein n=1 Tax=Platanthera guangdongensis TaxID=2320717 RepID=A0ABR2MCU9_9ASPA
MDTIFLRPLDPIPNILLPFTRRRCPSVPSADLAGAQYVAEDASVPAAIIIVHESRHFFAASFLGIRIAKFAIGFGPTLARFSSAGVEFSLRAFPLGGYVAFPDADDPKFSDSGIASDDPDLLGNHPLPHRVLVVSGVVTANILFAYLVLLSQCLFLGTPVRQGLEDLIKASPAKPISLNIARKTLPDHVIVKVVPDMDSNGTGRVGVQLSPNFIITRIPPANISEAIRISGREFLSLSASILDGLKETFVNFSKTAGKVSVPVAIIAARAEVARTSSDGLFQFAAVINLNLAAINLLPLPALDGGTLALLLVEAARGGRKLPREVERRITSSGILVILMLGLILIVRDTLNLDFVKEIL